jgi:rhodanese-related sulfurtransferase
MKKMIYSFIWACVGTVLLVLVTSSYAEEVPRITKEALQKKLCSSELILLDARTARSWDKSTQKIKCAQRVDPDNILSWAGALPRNKEIVIYCA